MVFKASLRLKNWHSLVAQVVKCLLVMQETRVQSLGWEDPLEKEMATHFSTLAWKIPWTEEPGRLQSMGLQRVGHDWATSLSLWVQGFPGGASGKELTCPCRWHKRHRSDIWVERSPGGGHGNPPQDSYLENPTDRGAWGPTAHRFSKSWTRLKRLSPGRHCKYILGVTDISWKTPLDCPLWAQG